MTQALTAAVSQPRLSQAQRIAQLLRLAGSEGLCLAQLPPDLAYTARNRLSEMRKAGMRIEGSPCRQHQHRSSVYRYTLHTEPQQLELGA